MKPYLQNTIHLSLPLTLLLFVFACGSNEKNDKAVNENLETLTAIATAVDTQTSNVDSLSDPGQIRNVTQSYDEHTQNMFDQMTNHDEEMPCYHDDMMQGVNQMAQEVYRYSENMMKASDINDMREETHQHAQTMHQMIENLQNMHHGMMDPHCDDEHWCSNDDCG